MEDKPALMNHKSYMENFHKAMQIEGKRQAMWNYHSSFLLNAYGGPICLDKKRAKIR